MPSRSYVASKVTCGQCQEPVDWWDAFRCLNCKLWFHDRCMAIHFGGRDGKPSTDQERIKHIESENAFLKHHLDILGKRVTELTADKGNKAQ